MANSERKRLVWTIKKGLFQLSSDELYQLATSISPPLDQDPAKLHQHDEEGCAAYVCSYMDSEVLLELEDEGMSLLLLLRDRVNGLLSKSGCHAEGGGDANSFHGNTVSVLPSSVHQHTQATDTGSLSPLSAQNTHANNISHIPTSNTDTDEARTLESQISKLLSMYNELKLRQCSSPSTTHMASAQPTAPNSHQSHCLSDPTPPCTNTLHATNTTDSMIALRDLPLLHRKEFKIHGGQIGDSTSDISYNNISKQIDEGLKDNHTMGEITRAVLRIIKPGNFKEMLESKEDMTVGELKSFLQSHLGEKSSTELFQELMTAKQLEQETPQQFLYRVMGLKQRVIFTSRQADANIRYEAQTAQNVFLHSVYQGLSDKHDDVRRELKPLLSDPAVTDEALLRQVTKTTSEESERKRRLGRSTRPKPAYAHSGEANINEVSKGKSSADINAKDELIHQLSAQVQALTQVVSSLQSNATPSVKSTNPEPHSHCNCQCSTKQSRPKRTDRARGCPSCIAGGRDDCNHCFICGEEGHRAVGCLKRTKPSGNVPRSW